MYVMTYLFIGLIVALGTIIKLQKEKLLDKIGIGIIIIFFRPLILSKVLIDDYEKYKKEDSDTI